MSDKIKPQHLSRKAILYVRQSSPYQVMNNLESQKLQYAMEAHLRSLGWSEVEIIDEDLGRSAGGSVTRTGFERMVAQVCLGEVGRVCAREVSRFARNSREWQQLVEVCRIVDTLLVDQETVYSPRLGNDRLLLGLKERSTSTNSTCFGSGPARPESRRRDAVNSSRTVRSASSRRRTGGCRRSPTSAFGARSNWYSRSSSNSAVPAKPYCGSRRTNCRSQPARSGAMFTGAGPLTAASTAS